MVLLKKTTIILSISLLFLTISVFAKNELLILNDINTKNFREKIDFLQLSQIKQICSYDYCDYVDIDDINSNLYNFTKKYIAMIDDEELQKMLLVKGIKITKIVLYD